MNVLRPLQSDPLSRGGVSCVGDGPVRTHGEADHLVVPRSLRLLHRLHEGPSVLVTLEHNTTQHLMWSWTAISHRQNPRAQRAHPLLTPNPLGLRGVCTWPHLHVLEDGLQSAVQLVWILELFPTTNQSMKTWVRLETSAGYGNGYICMMFWSRESTSVKTLIPFTLGLCSLVSIQFHLLV